MRNKKSILKKSDALACLAVIGTERYVFKDYPESTRKKWAAEIAKQIDEMIFRKLSGELCPTE